MDYPRRRIWVVERRPQQDKAEKVWVEILSRFWKYVLLVEDGLLAPLITVEVHESIIKPFDWTLGDEVNHRITYYVYYGSERPARYLRYVLVFSRYNEQGIPTHCTIGPKIGVETYCDDGDTDIVSDDLASMSESDSS